jgi:hypothetical protein
MHVILLVIAICFGRRELGFWKPNPDDAESLDIRLAASPVGKKMGRKRDPILRPSGAARED